MHIVPQTESLSFNKPDLAATKAQSKITVCIVVACLSFACSTPFAHAFALLGPYASWMEETNGLRQPGDIGGPMDIASGYRWNVPVVTYGFDQSFLDFFGSNGVAAVESAIQILNSLPPASQVVLTNYPLDSQQFNFVADAQDLYDLKSETLSMLLEQMGLAQPTRYIFVLRQLNPEIVVERNFDPHTLGPSTYVNGTLYAPSTISQNGENDILPFAVDPLAPTYTAVADENWVSGGFYTGLTEDDAGGLCYLLSTNNIKYETLLPGVAGVGTNANSFVNGAWRPGVDKITFIPHPEDSLSGAFLPTTNCFTDSYVTNGRLKQQQLARIISEPDLIFSAADVKEGVPVMPFFTRTGTTNWLNNATANGNTNGAGPGVIQPQVRIVFNKLGGQFSTAGNISDEEVFDGSQFWGSFDGSTNPPVIYPILQTGTNQLTVRMWLVMGTYPSWSTRSFVWNPTSAVGEQFTLQTSTNRIGWVSLFTLTNNGSIATYIVNNPASSSRFYRLVPQ